MPMAVDMSAELRSAWVVISMLPPVSPARKPPTDWGELVQIHDERDVTQASPDEFPVIDIHSL